MATAKLAKRVWGLATSSTGESLAAVTAGRCELPGISSHLCSNQSSPGAQWGCPPSYTATLLAFEGVSLGLWWAQQLQLKGTIHLFHSTGASAGVGVHWAFPAIAAPYPLVKGLESVWPVAGSILMGHLETGDVMDGPVDHSEPTGQSLVRSIYPLTFRSPYSHGGLWDS